MMGNKNLEVELAIANAKNSDLMNLSGKATLANALASQNVAESTQRLQISIENSVNKIIESNEILSLSNDKRSKAMNWLTLALVLISLFQLLINL